MILFDSDDSSGIAVHIDSISCIFFLFFILFFFLWVYYIACCVLYLLYKLFLTYIHELFGSFSTIYIYACICVYMYVRVYTCIYVCISLLRLAWTFLLLSYILLLSFNEKTCLITFYLIIFTVFFFCFFPLCPTVK